MSASSSVAELLRHLPEGGTLWVRGLGRSMWPLLRSGDAVQVLRCGAEAVAPGDLAVLLRADGGLTAHLVTGAAPVRTASLLGREDPSAELLGRVVRIRTRGLVLPVPELARPLLRAVQRLGSTAFRSPALRGARRLARAWGTSSWTRPGRARWLGALTVRPLLRGEEEALLVFAGHHLPRAAGELGPGLAGGTGWAVGVFDPVGRLRGFAFADGGAEGSARVRWLVVAPVAQRLGVGGALLRELAREASARGQVELRAELPSGDTRLLRLFRARGFREEAPGAAGKGWVLPLEKGPAPLHRPEG
ncbi:N-acetyltransferase [Vitiosangium sp. GDMCC 1.1324]|uniref:GNAT family N-acetyltransferase n=1 Tax=Vitiosangium sp. (strain GDMCC 1.1324) TaxID=2138576 RepID=UPI000D3AD9B6|nr:GNAT family N-acetyltransferase [Vitiosangium sp. GDMCC 1.1324]PTL83806.1 N-acetyltransferase [Vitiosangium sp. GDMCC 1.1324]